MLVIDWFMWQFPPDRKFLDSKKKIASWKFDNPYATIWFYSRWHGNIHFVDYSTGIGFLKSRLSNLHSIQLFDST